MFVSEPDSYTAVVNSDNAHELESAMDAEMQALHENNTWELVNYPEGRNVVGNK